MFEESVRAKQNNRQGHYQPLLWSKKISDTLLWHLCPYSIKNYDMRIGIQKIFNNSYIIAHFANYTMEKVYSKFIFCPPDYIVPKQNIQNKKRSTYSDIVEKNWCQNKTIEHFLQVYILLCLRKVCKLITLMTVLLGVHLSCQTFLSPKVGYFASHTDMKN